MNRNNGNKFIQCMGHGESIDRFISFLALHHLVLREKFAVSSHSHSLSCYTAHRYVIVYVILRQAEERILIGIWIWEILLSDHMYFWHQITHYAEYNVIIIFYWNSVHFLVNICMYISQCIDVVEVCVKYSKNRYSSLSVMKFRIEKQRLSWLFVCYNNNKKAHF